MKLPDELCEWCGAPFDPRRITQKYCSSACRDASRLDAAKHPPEAKTCPQCGGRFVTRRVVQQKYCSARCREIAQRAFKRAVGAEERRRARAGRTCAFCGSAFDARRRDQIYCSRKCHGRAQYAKRLARRQ